MTTLEEFRKRYKYEPNEDLLGEGGFSKVYKAYDVVENRTVALKFYYGELEAKYGVLAELNKVTTITHPNLVQYYDALLLQAPSVYDANDRVQVGIIEYINSGDLNDFVKTFPDEKTLAKVINDIFNGLAYLHKYGVIHRDIKPQNILMQQDNGEWIAKIADFGLSKRTDQGGVSSKLLGTMEYMAPEQFDPNKYGIEGKLATNVDLWAMGVILFELFTGELPFGGRNSGTSHEQVMYNIMKKNITTELEEVDEPYRSIIKWCLVKKAPNRARTAEQLIDIVEGKKQLDKQVFDDNFVASTTSTHEGLTQYETRWLFVGNVILSPIFGIILYVIWRKRYPVRANECIVLAWWSLAAWLAVLLVGVIIMILIESSNL